jgi:excisionase family DNA binding protein
MMDAQLGKAQLSLFEVDGLLPPSPPAATSHQPAPTRRRPPARSRQRREEPSAATPRPDASTAGSLLSPEQVACRCGLSRKAVYRAVARGELRAARILSRLRIDPHDVEAWVCTNIVDADRPVRAPTRPRLPATTGLRRLVPEP